MMYGFFIIGLLVSSVTIQCQVLQRFAPLSTEVEHIVTVERKNATELEFHIKDFDIEVNVSHYYWEIYAALDNPDDDLLNPVEIFLSDGKDVKVFKLPFEPWYEKKKFVLGLKSRKVHFCHSGILNDSLRVMMNSRGVKPVKVKLTVSTLSSHSHDWYDYEDFSNGKLKFISNSNLLLVSQPVLKEFLPSKLSRFNPGEYLLLQIQQPDEERCFTATVQRAGCANSDFPAQQRMELRQSMRTKATFLVDPSHYPSGLVVTVTSSFSENEESLDEMDVDNQGDCSLESKETANVRLSITTNSSKGDYYNGILFILLFFLGVFVIAVIVSSLGFVYKGELFENVESEARELADLSLDPDYSCSANYFISKEDLESLGIEVEEKHAKRMKENISLADLSKKMSDSSKSVEMYQKSALHWPLILILSMFYCIPAYQLVISEGPYRTKSNQDFCYYNFLCLKPYGKLTAFNNVFSNIGYICYGILFISLVSLKKRKFLKAIEKLDNFDCHKFGVPQDYSIFYGLGVALVMEGLMSGCYHICPKNIFFQFDTTYMYLIGILMQVKLYQNRHPDLSLGAIKTGVLLGIVLGFEAISYYEHRSPFWITFGLIYLIFILMVALHTYTLGALKYNRHIFWNSIRLFILEVRRALSCPQVPKTARPGQITSVKVRLLFVMILVIYNVGHVFYIIIESIFYIPPDNASSHILVMVMTNLFIYTIFYITMKLMHNEFLTWSCRLYFVGSVVLIFISIYFFTQTPKKQDDPPSISRGSNKECILFNFYDSHDLWHFLSACGLFTTFMFLLNIDEDLKYKERRLIPVF